jgi:hypothetical protein
MPANLLDHDRHRVTHNPDAALDQTLRRAAGWPGPPLAGRPLGGPGGATAA